MARPHMNRASLYVVTSMAGLMPLGNSGRFIFACTYFFGGGPMLAAVTSGQVCTRFQEARSTKSIDCGSRGRHGNDCCGHACPHQILRGGMSRGRGERASEAGAAKTKL